MTNNSNQTSSLLIDYAALKSEQANEITDLYDENLTIGQNLLELLSESIRFTNRRLYEPIVAAYLLLPSALCDTLPYLACIGHAGSGKSSVGFIASGLHGTNTLQGNSTFASLRNWVSKNSFYDEGNNQLKNCMLVWDDITGYFLKDIKMYSFLKSGYSLKSSMCSIAIDKGEILTFHTFCPKVLSSIDKFYLKTEFTEICRRLIIIPTEKLDNMGEQSLGQYAEKDATIPLINLKGCNLKPYKDALHQFWQTETNCRQFYATATQLRSRKKPIKVPKGIQSTDWELIPDLLACGYVNGIWQLQDGCDLLCEYFTYKQNEILKNKSILTEHINQFVIMSQYLRTDKAIIPQSLKDSLNIALKTGALDRHPSIETINEEMLNLGYTLQKQGGETYWLPISKK